MESLLPFIHLVNCHYVVALRQTSFRASVVAAAELGSRIKITLAYRVYVLSLCPVTQTLLVLGL